MLSLEIFKLGLARHCSASIINIQRSACDDPRAQRVHVAVISIPLTWHTSPGRRATPADAVSVQHDLAVLWIPNLQIVYLRPSPGRS
jgi:hypothetical protein